VVKHAILKRDDLAYLLSNLPSEVSEDAILRCFVRLAVQAPNGEQDNTSCVLAEVVGYEPCPPYQVVRSDGQRTTLRIKLRCKRGSSQRAVKISSVSNHELEEGEHEQWSRLTARTGIDSSLYTDTMLRKAQDINNAKNFKFDENTVSHMLSKKGNLEFDAAKESRMRFLLQCAMSQMDISSKSDNEAVELEQRYKDTLAQLHEQERKASDAQAHWFEKRPNLFSLKMINKKNYDRQVADDRHALEYTIATETSGKEGLNPFQRRACRPIVAWDTELTAVEGLDTINETKASEKATEEPASKPAESAASGDASNGELPGRAGVQRMERIVRAHSGARHILAGLSGFSR